MSKQAKSKTHNCCAGHDQCICRTNAWRNQSACSFVGTESILEATSLVRKVRHQAESEADLVERGDHDALALDLSLPQADKLIPGRAAVHHSLADVDAHGEAVALHAAGRVDGVPQEAVAGTLHAYHPGVRAAAVHTCRSGMHSLQARSQVTVDDNHNASHNKNSYDYDNYCCCYTLFMIGS